jgi:hypothetical protein
MVEESVLGWFDHASFEDLHTVFALSYISLPVYLDGLFVTGDKYTPHQTLTRLRRRCSCDHLTIYRSNS